MNSNGYIMYIRKIDKNMLIDVISRQLLTTF